MSRLRFMPSVGFMTEHNSAHTPEPAMEPTHKSVRNPAPAAKRRRLGLPLIAIIGLALLAVPRVIFHDLDIIQEGSAVNAFLVFLPPVAWIVVTLFARVPHPFLTILAIGVCYGIFLALGHQLLWDIAFADNPPRLGGNLTDLDPTAQAVMFRSFGALSSLLTGAVVGAIAGLVAWGSSALIGLRTPRPH